MAWAVAGRIEIMHPDVNKGAALTAIANHIGSSLNEVMAVGDGNNDLPMLRVAGTGVLMHNADAATHRAVAGENILQTDHIENDDLPKPCANMCLIGRGRILMGQILDIGRRIELVPMDVHFHDITIGLYRQENAQGTTFAFTHTAR